MKKIWDFKKVPSNHSGQYRRYASNLEAEGQGRGIIMGVTCLLLLGPFHYIQTNFLYFFAHDCNHLNFLMKTFEFLYYKFKKSILIQGFREMFLLANLPLCMLETITFHFQRSELNTCSCV